MLQNLFSNSGFVTKDHWTLFLKSLYIVSNLIIAIAYFIIPFILYSIWRKRKDISESWILLCFALLIFFCGLTHITEIVVFWWPLYRFYTLIYFITAIISIYTALVLPAVVRRKLRLVSREQYHHLLSELQKETTEKEIAIIKLKKNIEDLEENIRTLESIKNHGNWFKEQEQFLVNLKEMIRS